MSRPTTPRKSELTLLAAHASFLRPLEGLLDTGVIKGLVHIIGGGFLENIPRILPDGVSVEINRGTWPELPIFGLMQRLGNVDEKEMFRTFNMGIGMVVICSATEAETVQAHLTAFNIGYVKVDDGAAVAIV